MVEREAMTAANQTVARIVGLALILSACNPPEGKATSTGTLNGGQFSAVNAIFATNVPPSSFLVDLDGGSSLGGTITSMWISEDPNACYDLQGGTGIGRGLFAALFVADAGAATPGTVGVFGVTEASSGYEGSTAVVNSNACSGEYGIGGLVTVTAMSSSQLIGTFDVSFDGGDHTSGTFSASACPFAVCG